MRRTRSGRTFLRAPAAHAIPRTSERGERALHREGDEEVLPESVHGKLPVEGVHAAARPVLDGDPREARGVVAGLLVDSREIATIRSMVASGACREARKSRTALAASAPLMCRMAIA